MCDKLQVTKESMNKGYLGLPVHVGRSIGGTFAYLKDRIWRSIQGWKEKFLSWAGKEVLIKAVAQAIPTFAMGCFDLTKSLCGQINKMVCWFWWNQQEGKHKIHWLSRDMLQKDKKDGGLGFRDIHAFNLAMLAKQCWRLWNRPESLCAKILKAKYYANSMILEAKPKQGMSYTWKSILRGLDVIKMGMKWRVGDGRNLKIWSDPWILRDLSRHHITPRGGSILSNVDDLIDPGTGSWDVELVRDIF